MLLRFVGGEADVDVDVTSLHVLWDPMTAVTGARWDMGLAPCAQKQSRGPPLEPIHTVMLPFRRFPALLLVVAFAAVIPMPSPAAVVGRARATANDNTPWTLPTRPPTCTSKQVSSGAVASCLVAGWDAPDSNGWPSPPFPSDPTAGSGSVAVIPMAGWKFNGYGYNGSPALADWEAMLITNQQPIGPVRVNQLRGMPDAMPLFEGFLRDITAGGYRVSDAGMYSFRCTSGSGMSCAGRTRDSLSNHSWGLAMDMNSGPNPEATYVGIGGASACATPVKTDLPMWVIRTAEKWGLYWGGYGWGGGCDSPDQMRTAATRDATHFEFRGSPNQARAIAAVNMGEACLDVADDAGVVSPRCLTPGDVPRTGWRVVVATQAPKGATAALVNLTITGAQAPGFITAESCGPVPAGQRTSSNGNVIPGQTVANLAVVPLDSSGRFCVYRSQPMHTIVDVQGFFASASAAGADGTLYTAVAPQRLVDTRVESFCGPGGDCTDRGPVSAATEMAVSVPMVPANARATLANLTVTDPASDGYLTADSCATLTPGAQTHSNANFASGETVANLAVVPIGAGIPEFCTYATAQTHDIVDVAGYFAPPAASGSGQVSGLGYASQAPKRLVDTRGCWTDVASNVQRCGQVNEINSVLHLQAPAGAAAVLINLTLTDAALSGFASAEACSLTEGPPRQSSGNVAAGHTSANLAVVSVDRDGTFCVVVSAPMHVIIDLQGTFSTDGSLRFLPVAPVRRSDTRIVAG